MSRQRIAAVVVKDWKELLRNPQAVVPVVVLPLVLVGVLPALLIVLGGNPAVTGAVNGMDAFLDNLPDGVVPAGYDETQTTVYALLVYFFAPMFLLIPVAASVTAASQSFAGERERRTLEGLLYSPLRARELVPAKIVASFLPSIVLTWFAFVLYAVVVNTLGSGLFGGAILPTASWAVLAVLLAPAVAFLVVGLVVGASLHARTVQSAQSVAAFLVLPLVALVIGQVTGVALFDVRFALALAAIVVVLDIVVVTVLVRRFDREALVLRL
ncbi:ABC transporter permease subunit [Georgenia sp. TF02-10]|uniref:ABC transporter permease subunit n=1 Tax=Georgenia sp. TF02-10 TaxID=2917725 RepID=UPI001FA79B85|nr:ABC transporter permease subunit [Georgenia sp. TF02-10]UNX54703.1 ABC transporter permease subunit [Georgenia sp. TF02-10]